MKTVLVLLFIFGAAFAAPALGEAEVPEPRFQTCPTGWVNFQNRCYMFVHSAMYWQNAEYYCRGFGAHLASVTSYAEYSHLQQLTENAGQTSAWLGGFYLQDQWMWIDSEGFYFTYWYSKSTPSSNPCIYLQTTTGWRNNSCNSSYCFICSKNLFGC